MRLMSDLLSKEAIHITELHKNINFLFRDILDFDL